jgi:DNA-binding MarR family transcriptional regulator
MTKFEETDAYRVIWLTRRLFRSLAQKSNESVESFGITAVDRAVMEFLYPEKSLSVPDIARKYQVTRQHVQVTINNLIEAGLVKALENPQHKRSSLMKLTAKGIKLFASILKNDERAVKAMFSDIPESDLAITRETLESLFVILKGDSK